MVPEKMAMEFLGEISMRKAMCRVQLKGKNRAKDLMKILGLNEQ